MIRLDLTTHSVMVEGDGDLDHLITVRTFQTAGSSSRVARCLGDWTDAIGASRDGRQTEIEETVRSRSGANVMREYDIDEPGVYALTSGRREMSQNRSFFIRVAFPNREEMQIAVLPGSFPCPWVVEDEFHNYQRDETFQFNIRVTHTGVAVAEGEVTRIESDQTGVKFERTTAWERILEDDDSNSV